MSSRLWYNVIMQTDSSMNCLRKLPSVNRLLSSPQMRDISGAVPVSMLAGAARSVLQAAREECQLSGEPVPDIEALASRAASEAVRMVKPTLRSAINASGVVLHTGLGRARLAKEAVEALIEAAEGHSLLEVDAETGRRGSRQEHVSTLLQELTGAEDAAVVNNCAGAVFLAITALAQNREVVISRGELVEIGGAFRMPDIIRASGAILVEVGATNRTRISDYEQAITERTALILRCRPSNFAQVGFTESVPTYELAVLGNRTGIPVMDDQGSGALIEVIHGKGTLAHSISCGCDIVTGSGDKLLGGPQAGLILGRKHYVQQTIRHPLARALRVDKLTLAALEATLRIYRDPQRAVKDIPTLRYLLRTEQELKKMALRLQTRLRNSLPKYLFEISIQKEQSQVGGGSLPDEPLPTFCVALRSGSKQLHPDALARSLRLGYPSVFARIRDDTLLFDPRTLEDDEIPLLVAAVERAVKSLDLEDISG